MMTELMTIIILCEMIILPMDGCEMIILLAEGGQNGCEKVEHD
jgi:hypothetical protein